MPISNFLKFRAKFHGSKINLEIRKYPISDFLEEILQKTPLKNPRFLGNIVGNYLAKMLPKKFVELKYFRIFYVLSFLTPDISFEPSIAIFHFQNIDIVISRFCNIVSSLLFEMEVLFDIFEAVIILAVRRYNAPYVTPTPHIPNNSTPEKVIKTILSKSKFHLPSRW